MVNTNKCCVMHIITDLQLLNQPYVQSNNYHLLSNVASVPFLCYFLDDITRNAHVEASLSKLSVVSLPSYVCVRFSFMQILYSVILQNISKGSIESRNAANIIGAKPEQCVWNSRDDTTASFLFDKGAPSQFSQLKTYSHGARPGIQERLTLRSGKRNAMDFFIKFSRT